MKVERQPMESDAPLSVNQKIARLRGIFIDQLPGRLEQILELWLRLKANLSDMDALTELHRFVHSLKGTGRSFGFDQLGNAAEGAETLLGSALDNAPVEPAPTLLEQLEQFILAIEHEVLVISSEGLTDETEAEPLLEGLACEPFSTFQDCRSKLIYICDDDNVTAQQLSTQLSCFGYNPEVFLQLDSLSRSVRENRPDALLMDIHFPEGRYAGTDLVNLLRKEIDYNLPVIFLSSRDDFDARISAVLAGGTDYFTKPPNMQEMVSSLDRLTFREKMEPYRVMVVDDEPTVAHYHSLILQEAGMTTCCVNEPSCILGVLQQFRPDLVLMDMYMPVCTGYDLAKMIRQVHEYTAIPIIYLSSEQDRQKQLFAMRIGAEGFMTKPVVPAELVAAVEIRAERMRTLRSMMVRDSLTGLFNHTTTTHLLDSALANTMRHGKNLSFAMIDIDHFKKVNDTYGHPRGDQVILALSRILRQRLRTSDIIGRYGGEEFAVLLTETDSKKAFELVDELREDFSHLTFNANDVVFSCTFSAGIASFGKFWSLEHIREASDQALYRAKQGGRNRVVVA